MVLKSTNKPEFLFVCLGYNIKSQKSISQPFALMCGGSSGMQSV